MFFVMINHEETADDAATLEAARVKGQALCDAEVLPCTFSIYNEDQWVEDIQRSDRRDLSQLITDFNRAFPKSKD